MMKRFSDTNDADFERLLGERVAENDASPHDAVTGFFSAIEDIYPEEPTSALEERHVGAMMGTARAMEASVEANQLIAEAASASRARSRFIARFASHGWSSVAGIALLLVFAYGGAAYAGVLPDPIQQATSDLVARIGVHVPTPLDGGNGRAIGLRRISDEKYDGGWSPGRARTSGEATPGVGAGVGAGLGRALGPDAPASLISTPGAGGAREATGSPNANAAGKGAAASAAAKKTAKKATSKSKKAAKKATKSKKAAKKSSAGSSSSGNAGNSANGGNSGNGNSGNGNSGNGNGNSDRD
jgi:uncharacterized membrane protein YgcG